MKNQLPLWVVFRVVKGFQVIKKSLRNDENVFDQWSGRKQLLVKIACEQYIKSLRHPSVNKKSISCNHH